MSVSEKAAPEASAVENPSKTDKFDPRIVQQRIDDLRPNPNNARTHNTKQIAQIRKSIERFGFTNPVLVDECGQILAGHGRLAAARQMGLQTVPTIRLDHLSEAEKRAYVLADNRLAELADWDREILAIELQGLMELELDFDVTVTGFELPEIDLLIGNATSTTGEDPDDDVAEPSEDRAPVSVAGDLWVLGEHRLLCGNALDPSGVATLMEHQTARMMFTDPPYNVPIDGHVCGAGRIRHREFVMASGEMSEPEFGAFLARSLALMADHCHTGALLYTCMDWRHLETLLSAGRNTGLALLNICVWAKDNGGMGSFYRSQHEMVCVFKNGDVPHINNVQLGRFGRNRTNVWSYPGVNSLRAGRLEDLAMHPTVKPTALVADAILDCTHPGDIVLDAFGGSGTTIIAAERTGRRGFVVEIDPTYVDVAIRRWQKLTGHEARHANLGQTFNKLEQERPQTQNPETSAYRVRQRRAGHA